MSHSAETIVNHMRINPHSNMRLGTTGHKKMAWLLTLAVFCFWSTLYTTGKWRHWCGQLNAPSFRTCWMVLGVVLNVSDLCWQPGHAWLYPGINVKLHHQSRSMGTTIFHHAFEGVFGGAPFHHALPTWASRLIPESVRRGRGEYRDKYNRK